MRKNRVPQKNDQSRKGPTYIAPRNCLKPTRTPTRSKFNHVPPASPPSFKSTCRWSWMTRQELLNGHLCWSGLSGHFFQISIVNIIGVWWDFIVYFVGFYHFMGLSWIFGDLIWVDMILNGQVAFDYCYMTPYDWVKKGSSCTIDFRVPRMPGFWFMAICISTYLSIYLAS